MMKKLTKLFLLMLIAFDSLTCGAQTWNTFYGGVTGIPGHGTTWGDFFSL